MNLSPLRRQAEHNADAGWSWCLVHPAQVLQLWALLVRIRMLAERARRELADHHPEALGETLTEIEFLATLDKE